jgi:hypothetical protein
MAGMPEAIGRAKKKGRMRCKRPKSREETPKEGGGSAKLPATFKWPVWAENASDTDLFYMLICNLDRVPRIRFQMKPTVSR